MERSSFDKASNLENISVYVGRATDMLTLLAEFFARSADITGYGRLWASVVDACLCSAQKAQTDIDNMAIELYREAKQKKEESASARKVETGTPPVIEQNLNRREASVS